MHFLTEFLTGTQFYLLTLGVFSVLFWVLPLKHKWISFLVTTFMLAYMAHMIVPDRSDDLQLYFWFIDDMREGGRSTFDYFVKQNDFDWQTYRVSAWLFYGISKLPDSTYDHFLSSIVVFISYGLNFCILDSVSKRYEVDRIHTYLGTMFFLSTYWYFDLASGIRNGFAFAAAFAASYFFIVAKKYRILCIIGFVVATFFHSGGVMPVIIFAMTLLTLRFPSRFVNFLMIFGIAVGTVLLRYLAGFSENGLIQTAAEKSEKYEDTRVINTNTNYIVNIVVVIVVVLILLYVVNYYKNSDENNSLNRLYKLSSNTMFFMVGAVAVGLIFVRFSRWILPVIGAANIMIGLQLQKNDIEEKGVSYTNYYSPPLERFKYRIRPVVIAVLIALIVVHIWYNVNGSSLIWAHFEHEWLEKGIPYYWGGGDYMDEVLL